LASIGNLLGPHEFCNTLTTLGALLIFFYTRIQGSFFWLQNTEGEPMVGGWLQIHQPEVLPPYFAARKKNPARIVDSVTWNF
jgi:hypothetical protein